MRILLVYDHLDIGGAQTHGLGLSKYLLRAGHEVAVASRGGRMQPSFERQGVQHIHWRAPRRTDGPALLKSMCAAKALTRVWRPDVVHAHAVLPGLLFARAAKRVPLIVTPHRHWRSLYRFRGGRSLSAFFHRLLHAHADHIIAISQGMYRELLQQGLSSSRCTLIPNGVDVGPIDAACSHPTLDARGESIFGAGMVGRLIAQKGVDTFIAAAGLVLKKLPQIRFAIAGDGPLRAACRRQIATLGIDERIALLGAREDVPALLSQMSVFVSASRWEGMSYALLEALAARSPVVATRVPGSSELINDGENGLLVSPDDPQALSDAIIRLLNDREFARALGAAGRRMIESNYTLQRMAQRVALLYECVINATCSSA